MLAPFRTLTADHFDQIPTFEQCIQPYKDQARELPESTKLTSRQHRVARFYGSDDWQSFQYFIRELQETLHTVALDKEEWAYIFDITNGWGATIQDAHYGLLMNVVDGDRYEYLSGKWFGENSKAWEDDDGEHYEPTPRMRQFIEKLQALTEKQAIAVVLKGLTFWGTTFIAQPKV